MRIFRLKDGSNTNQKFNEGVLVLDGGRILHVIQPLE
jgi:hypothetical protein